MQVKIKKLLPNAVIPKYAKAGDAGLDLTVAKITKVSAHGTEFGIDEPSDGFKIETIVCDAGIAVEIPEGYVGLLFPRSSIVSTDLILSNCVGVIDSGYRGTLMCKFKFIGDSGKIYGVGERFAQLVIIPYPKVEFVEVDELSDSERGVSGYGSSNITLKETVVDLKEAVDKIQPYPKTINLNHPEIEALGLHGSRSTNNYIKKSYKFKFPTEPRIWKSKLGPEEYSMALDILKSQKSFVLMRVDHWADEINGVRVYPRSIDRMVDGYTYDLYLNDMKLLGITDIRSEEAFYELLNKLTTKSLSFSSPK